MEPRIQYARTSDGVRIAYFTLGEGPAVVMMPGPISNIQAEFEMPGAQRWHGDIGGGRLLVRYDHRGMGLSDRNIAEFTVDSFVEDLRAVVDRLELAQFDLLSPLFSAPAASSSPRSIQSASVVLCSGAGPCAARSSRPGVR